MWPEVLCYTVIGIVGIILFMWIIDIEKEVKYLRKEVKRMQNIIGNKEKEEKIHVELNDVEPAEIVAAVTVTPPGLG